MITLVYLKRFINGDLNPLLNESEDNLMQKYASEFDINEIVIEEEYGYIEINSPIISDESKFMIESNSEIHFTYYRDENQQIIKRPFIEPPKSIRSAVYRKYLDLGFDDFNRLLNESRVEMFNEQDTKNLLLKLDKELKGLGSRLNYLLNTTQEESENYSILESVKQYLLSTFHELYMSLHHDFGIEYNGVHNLEDRLFNGAASKRMESASRLSSIIQKNFKQRVIEKLNIENENDPDSLLIIKGEFDKTKNEILAKSKSKVYIPTHLTPPIRFDLTPLFRWV